MGVTRHTANRVANVNLRVPANRRPVNCRNLLHLFHPFRYTHIEAIRSLQCTPVSSRKYPKLPHKVTRRETTEKTDAALYYLTLFCPIEPISGRLMNVGEKCLYPDASWSTFMHFLQFLGKNDGDFPNLHKLELICRMKTALCVNAKKKLCFTKYNYRGCKTWDEQSISNGLLVNERNIRRNNPAIRNTIPPEYVYQLNSNDRFIDDDIVRRDINGAENNDCETQAILSELTRRIMSGENSAELALERRVLHANNILGIVERLMTVINAPLIALHHHNHNFTSLISNNSNSALIGITIDSIAAIEARLDKNYVEDVVNEVVIPTIVNPHLPLDFMGILSPIILENGDEPAEGVGILPPEGTIILNPIQEALCVLIYKRQRNIINANMDPTRFPLYPQLLMYIDNGPGTGKSTVLMEVIRRVNVYAARMKYPYQSLTTSFSVSATTGCAANRLPKCGANTMHTAYKFNVIVKKGESHNKPLNGLSNSGLCIFLKLIFFIILYEYDFISSVYFIFS